VALLGARLALTSTGAFATHAIDAEGGGAFSAGRAIVPESPASGFYRRECHRRVDDGRIRRIEWKQRTVRRAVERAPVDATLFDGNIERQAAIHRGQVSIYYEGSVQCGRGVNPRRAYIRAKATPSYVRFNHAHIPAWAVVTVVADHLGNIRAFETPCARREGKSGQRDGAEKAVAGMKLGKPH
jgi:hypothetical protein